MRVLIVSPGEKVREELPKFLREYLNGRGWEEPRIECMSFSEFRLDQHSDPASVVLIDLHPDFRAGRVFETLRNAAGDRPYILCVYPRFSPSIERDAKEFGGADGCLHGPREKVRCRKTLLRFFEEHLAELVSPGDMQWANTP